MNEFLWAVKDLEIKELIMSKWVESNEPQPENILHKVSEEDSNECNESSNDSITGDEADIVGSNNSMQQTEAGKLFQCKMFDKSLVTASGLWQHNKSEHEGVKNACNLCNQQYSEQGSLTKQIQSKHYGVKYDCNQCDYQSTDKGNLRRHIQFRHNGVKYSCIKCGQQFNYQQSLTAR